MILRRVWLQSGQHIVVGLPFSCSPTRVQRRDADIQLRALAAVCATLQGD